MCSAKKQSRTRSANEAPGEESEMDAESRSSMRRWLATLEKAGQLRRISAEVDWELEIGAIARINLSMNGPALLFENIKDYQETLSTRLMTCGMSNREQVCLMLGLPAGTCEKAIVLHMRDVFKNPIEPVVVETGPVKQNILKHEDVDLFQFPAPKWHHLDGGRYIDTYCGVVTRDLDTGRNNIGLYRGQLHTRNKIGKLLLPTQGGGGHFTKYKGTQEHMPIAVAYGGNDVIAFCAGCPFPRHICEWDMMGAILGHPIELVKCETVDLEVPASAEVVVEGYIDPDPDTFELEGPFGEYPGYYGGTPTPKPVLHVNCITHRDDPIMRGALEGCRPGFPSEDSVLVAYGWSAILWNMLENTGVTGITDVWCPPVSTGTNVVVQIRKHYRGHAQQVAAAIWGTSAAQWSFKNVMVVEEDIDIRDPVALDWAMAFRVNAGAGQLLTYGPTFGSVLDPSTPHAESNVLKYGTGKWTRVLIDATRNWDLEPNPDWNNQRFPPVGKLTPELEQRIRARWEEYGIGLPYLSDEVRELLTLEKLSKILPVV
ncbi:MAG: UbiD family decarboxylase [Gammaproteobacteria bacterium]